MDRGNEALINRGYAEAQHEEFLSCYEMGLYSLAASYARGMDVYYGYAYTSYMEALGFFRQAQQYAITNEQKEFITNYIKAIELVSQMMDELHQAGEYYETACNYYDQERWNAGNEALEEGNRHIEAHDALVDDYNSYLAKVEAALQSW